MSLTYLTENQEATIKMVLLRGSEKDYQGQPCWCSLTMDGPSQYGLHTGHCHVIREYLGIKEKGESDGRG